MRKSFIYFINVEFKFPKTRTVCGLMFFLVCSQLNLYEVTLLQIGTIKTKPLSWYGICGVVDCHDSFPVCNHLCRENVANN